MRQRSTVIDRMLRLRPSLCSNIYLVGQKGWRMSFTSNNSDTIYGAHGGFQRQWGQWVLGVEASYEEARNQMESSVSVSPLEPFTHLAATTRINRLFTIGPRGAQCLSALAIAGIEFFCSAPV